MPALVLGSVVFVDLQIPEKVGIPGEQNLVVHKLIGGERVIDAMGPDPGEIEWSGRFRDGNAVTFAARLEAMRDSGQPQTLVCGTITKTVLVKHFQWDYERPYQAAYTIKLTVVNNGPNIAPIKQAPFTLDALIFQDMRFVTKFIGIFPSPVTI